MKISSLLTIISAIAVSAVLVSIYFAVSANFYTIQFALLIGIQCLGIFALLNLKGEAQRRENKTNNINEVSQ